MPTASMSAYIVVGPTKAKPLRLSALDSARDSGEVVGTSAYVCGRGVVGRLERPHERGEVALRVVAQPERGPGVGDRREHLGAVAHDPGIRHQALDVGLAVPGHDLRVEAVEGQPERRALAQDRGPGQARLERLEREPLEQAALVAHRHAPLGVVVLAQHRVDRCPDRAGQPVVTVDDPRAAHDRLSVTIGTSGGAATRIAGPQAPAPREVTTVVSPTVAFPSSIGCWSGTR